MEMEGNAVRLDHNCWVMGQRYGTYVADEEDQAGQQIDGRTT